MKQNTFKNGIEPQRIQPDKPKLNPPIFEEALIDFRNKNIFWHTALQKQDAGSGFKK